MNVESIVQTVLITTLLGLIPKILEALLKLSYAFSWNDLRNLRHRQVVVTIEYEQQINGKTRFETKGNVSTHMLLDDLYEYITHYVGDKDVDCRSWQVLSATKMLPQNDLIVDGVTLCCQQNVSSVDKSSTVRQAITLRAASRHQITALFKAAKRYHDSLLCDYPPKYISQNMKKSEPYWICTNLRISTTWDDLFYPERDILRKQVDSLGEGGKITILLHGPPGTGKTSTIRAIAAATKRNVVNIDLGLVRNNQELHEIVFDTLHLDSRTGRQVLNYIKLDSKFIFVFEEMDVQLEALAMRNSTLQLSTSKADESEDAFEGYYKSLKKLKENQLTIGGLLTLIDGIQQMQDSILIMTTNHPEKLDPRLLRAGRVTHNIRLGHLEPRFARAMIERVHGKSPEEVRENHWIPAELEQLLAQFTEYEDFLVQFSMHQQE